MVFLLTKSSSYFCDMDAIREPFAEGTYRRILQEGFDEQEGGPKDYGLTGVEPNRFARRALENLAPKVRQAALEGGEIPDPQVGLPWNAPGKGSRQFADRDPAHLRSGGKQARDKTAETPHLGGRRQAPEPGEPNAFHPLGRNVRDVWAINPEPFDYEMCRACKRVYDGREYAMLADAPRDNDAPPKKVCRCGRSDEWLSHFAVFPQALVLPCVLAGTSERGCCSQCGAPWERILERTPYGDLSPRTRGMDEATVGMSRNNFGGQREWDAYEAPRSVGWRATCSCKQATVPCAVLDPFVGSGTTLLVAAKNGRTSVGVELQSDYIPLIRKRLEHLETDLIHPTKVVVLETDLIHPTRVEVVRHEEEERI